jgi:putative tryptophan/tyrosine transport system substrate-binding protein
MITLGDAQRMRRREFIGLLGGAVAWPFDVNAQQPAKVARIGYLVTSSLESPEARAPLNAFREGLREHGYVEGQNILIEYRAADGSIERFPRLATELASLNLDLILAPNTPAALAAQQATNTIPIVVAAMGDPVGDGLVASLARPGRNITGLTFLGPELAAKRLGLLKEALPKTSRVAALWHPGAFGERTTIDMLKSTDDAARTLAVELQFVEVQGADAFDRAFSEMTRNHVDAFIQFSSAMLFAERTRIVDLATKHRLPSMFAAKEFVELGGLMAYGASINDLFRRCATDVDKILKGTKPADLPVEQPTKFELVVNLKTMRELGLTISRDFLLLADEVIE